MEKRSALAGVYCCIDVVIGIGQMVCGRMWVGVEVIQREVEEVQWVATWRETEAGEDSGMTAKETGQTGSGWQPHCHRKLDLTLWNLLPGVKAEACEGGTLP